MKKIIFVLISLVFFVSLVSVAQDETPVDSLKMPNDQIVINILSNTWLNSPSDITLMPVSIGTEVYTMTPIIGKNSALSLAIGCGVGATNVHHNALPYDSLGVTYFRQIPGGYEYIKNKFTAAYIDIPIEVRFRTKPNIKKRNFKVALGGKFGYMISNYIKYSGDDFRVSSKKFVKFKEYNMSNTLPYRYGIFLRIGYGKINGIVNYTLSSLFEKNKGPDVIPVSFGLSFTIL
ncbi:MAG: outer membrane beta-barrel protein [Bacteroidia bacterium]|nr:outer membrane beta-barrel protein [Bacteroidia bacterium]